MSQSLSTDFPIDPTTTSGTALADILNRFSDSVFTSNAGATAPPDTMPGMLWLDTSGGANGVLKMRNAANTGWITLSTPGGAFMLADGSIPAPSLAFTNEPGLGWLRGGPSVISVAAQGQQIAYLNAGTPAATFMGIFPRQNGSASLFLVNQTGAATTYNTLGFVQNADGSAGISTSAAGAAVRGNLSLNAPAVTVSGTLETVSGQIRINQPGGFPVLLLNKTVNAVGNVLQGNMNGVGRWVIYLGNTENESGGNSGSNFSVGRFDDAGGFAGDAFSVNRANGTLLVNNRVSSYFGYSTKFGISAALQGNAFNVAWDTSGTGTSRVYIDDVWSTLAMPSDERLKDNITDLVLTDDEFMKIRTIEFDWQANELRSVAGHSYGFSAQNFLAEFPNAGAVSGSDESMYGLHDLPVLAMAVNRIQDLINRVKQLEGATP